MKEIIEIIYKRILEERYTDNQVMQAATSQTKVKKSSEDANISNRPQAKTKLPNNIELEVTVWDLLNYNKKRHLEILFKKLSVIKKYTITMNKIINTKQKSS